MIPKDKILHLIAGGVIAAIAFLLCHYVFDWNKSVSALISILGAIIAGLVRELQNYYFPIIGRKPLFDVMDWIYTSIGGCIVSLILFWWV